MINEIMKNINTDNIIPILISLVLVIAIIARLYMQIKEAIVKVLRVASIVIGIVCLVGIQQGVFGNWVTKIATYIK